MRKAWKLKVNVVEEPTQFDGSLNTFLTTYKDWKIDECKVYDNGIEKEQIIKDSTNGKITFPSNGEVITEQIQRGGLVDTSDKLLYTETGIVSINSVWQGTTTYEENKDYMLQLNKISWSPNGQEPEIYSNYNIQYIRNWIPSVKYNYEYKISRNPESFIPSREINTQDEVTTDGEEINIKSTKYERSKTVELTWRKISAEFYALLLNIYRNQWVFDLITHIGTYAGCTIKEMNDEWANYYKSNTKMFYNITLTVRIP